MASLSLDKVRFSFLTCLIALGVGCEQSKPIQTPEFSEQEYNFGSIQSGENETRVVELHNPGKSTIRVDRVAGSCNCIETDEGPIELEPDSSRKIELRFTDVFGGPNSYRVQAIANDQILCETTIRFEGKRPLVIIPQKTFAGVVPVNSQEELVIPYHIRNEHQILLTGIKLEPLPTDAPLLVSLDESDFEDTNTFRLIVRGNQQTKRRGFHHQQVRLEVGHSNSFSTIDVFIIVDLRDE
ncbi:hypothetical protein Pla22_17000 [Rubripirellula amarantea]|uniref:DUF1573 domain-containing protein n=1 Tax=Rubripirellula amarantea TaxID=2527999 RepID=A0A5C5WVU8_9BACT|nr:hypothetical protein Pla22_17000 [Rubripirellula amarantea]